MGKFAFLKARLLAPVSQGEKPSGENERKDLGTMEGTT